MVECSEDLLYPPLEPFDSGHLQVSELHSIYYEQCGSADGVPVVFVHGGPGGGFSPRGRRFFDPKAYHIIMFDQRGCGKSTPTFCLEENDTWSLVEDMEKLRKHLKIDRWMLFGGSWGCTLSLVYAETHIDRVLALVLSGIFTLRPEELHWFYQEGTSLLFPDEFEKYIEPIPIEERGDLVKAYYKRLVTSTDEEERIKYAKAWTTWEMSTAQLQANPENIQKALDDTWSLAFARIECHYFVNKGFLKPNQVLDNAEIIEKSRVPVTIVQGRYDVICPVTNAWQLKKRIPSAEFQVVPDAGHSSKELGMTAMLVAACDKYKTILKK